MDCGGKKLGLRENTDDPVHIEKGGINVNSKKGGKKVRPIFVNSNPVGRKW